MSGLTHGWTTQALTTYVFVDGGYLNAFAANMGKEWFGVAAELDYQRVAQRFSGKRTFYYDCLPAKTDNETDGDHQAKLRTKEEFFDSLRALPGWHVSEGLAKWRKKAGSTQKEVDILIAVDMLTHRKNMDAITFIAGDLDFRPLVEAVVREGMYINLHFGKGSIAKELRNSVDAAEAIGPLELYDLCTRSFQGRHGITQKSTKVGGPNGPIIAHGKVGRETVALLHGPDPADKCYKIGCSMGHMSVHYRDSDLRRLKAIHGAYHGPTEWLEP
jgi:uncharacterized LabA/DUF88 family protein